MSLVFVFDVVLLDLWNLSFNFENNLKKWRKKQEREWRVSGTRKKQEEECYVFFFFLSNTTKHFYTMPIFTIHFLTKPTRLCKLNRFPFKPKPKLLLHNNIISAYAFKTPSLAYCTTCFGFGLAKFLIFFSCVFYSVVSISLAYSFI